MLFVAADELALQDRVAGTGAPGRVLRDGGAYRLELPGGWRGAAPADVADYRELYVIRGELTVNDVVLGEGDYFEQSPPATWTLGAGDDGALALLFRAPEAAPVLPGSYRRVVGSRRPWVAGMAMRAAGRDDVPLAIRHFRNDPRSGARTYLVRVAAGLSIPWEVHAVAEEAYLLSGDFTLVECLADGEREHRYEPGGYFYRLPGIAHNGPRSGSDTGALMLIRTPGPLTVTLVDGCDPDRADVGAAGSRSYSWRQAAPISDFVSKKSSNA